VAANKLERAKQLLAEAQVAASALQGTHELRCHRCGRVLLHYDAPIARVTLPCRRCGRWIDFSTERDERLKSS